VAQSVARGVERGSGGACHWQWHCHSCNCNVNRLFQCTWHMLLNGSRWRWGSHKGGLSGVVTPPAPPLRLRLRQTDTRACMGICFSIHIVFLLFFSGRFLCFFNISNIYMLLDSARNRGVWKKYPTPFRRCLGIFAITCVNVGGGS